MPAYLENSEVATGLEKVNFHSNPRERQCQRMFKLHNCNHLHASKVMLKTLQARLHQYVNCELLDAQAGFRKGRGNRDQIANICWITEKAREFQKKKLLLLHWLAKAFVWIFTNCGKFLEVGVPDHLTCLLRNLYSGQETTVRTGHGTMNWFQSGKVCQGCICHPGYLTYMQSTSCKISSWVNHKLESRLPWEISMTSDM